jgi:multiple sugar transport system substrate-binding protein
MTTQLDFSVFDQGINFREQIREMLARFEKQERIKVNLVVLPWQEGWERMVNVALYGEGFDVSEIGSTWVGDFIKMDALAPFTSADLQLVGHEEDFFPASWSSGVTKNPDGSSNVWSIPWAADSRMIYYRRDLLEKAGVAETTAFDTLAHFEHTLTALKESGVEIPLTLPMGQSRRQIHILASFVWQAGGGFMAGNGKEVIFHHPEARTGMKTYFGLGKHLVSQVQHINENTADQYFTEGKAAVTISGTWILSHTIPETLRPHIGTAMLPGVSWVGGTNFVVWKNCRFNREAVRLIRFLTISPQCDVVYPILGLPARLHNLEAPLYSTDTNRQVLRQAVLAGRAFSTAQLWGLVESRLSDLFPVIWEKIFSEPETEIETILEQFIPALARRLSLTLSARD